MRFSGDFSHQYRPIATYAATERSFHTVSVASSRLQMTEFGQLFGRFGRLFDQRRDLFGMREKCDMASRELDRLRFGPATHESLELGIDHTVLCGDDRIARLLRPRG